MCGIAAIFAYHSDAPGVDAGELLSIRDCMTARGPDAAGEWYGFNGRVGLGAETLRAVFGQRYRHDAPRCRLAYTVCRRVLGARPPRHLVPIRC